jgi:glycosyltransferase involved in cell wall biosynthesis
MDIASTAVELVFYHLYTAMRQLGLPVVLDDPDEKCIEMWHGWYFEPKGGNVNVFLTTGISTITQTWERWREADIIFISSEFFRERNADCDVPIYIWHHRGIDPDIFRVLDRSDEPFVFTHAVFPQKHKGSDLLCEAFKETFSAMDNVFLYIQHPNCEAPGLIEFKRQYADDKIKFIPQPYTRRREAWKLYTGDCYVYPSLLDGSANTVIEALSTGMPALLSDMPLFRELLDDKCVWWLPMYNEEPQHGFGRPHIEDISRMMLHIYQNREEIKQKGQYGAKYVRARYCWQGCIIREFLPVMREHGYLL